MKKEELKKTAEELATETLKKEQIIKVQKYSDKFNKLVKELEENKLILDISMTMTTRGNFPQINIIPKQ